MIQKKKIIPWNKGLKLGPNPEHSKRMKGRKITEEARKKMSLSKKGKIPKNLEQLNANKFGSNNPAWRGGITKKNYRLRRNKEFKLWRKAIFERDDFTCQKCGILGGVLNPHHLLNFSDFKELRYAIDNGITLCSRCHKGFHNKYGYRNNTREQIEEFIKN
jgi:hypothetical protein